ncbi:hypothetical protein QBC39DRAFT_333678 [Podospora conica]|nr:hypothetical protein QBC39DRAFT_333678 [Schizothecium conicum]
MALTTNHDTMLDYKSTTRIYGGRRGREVSAELPAAGSEGGRVYPVPPVPPPSGYLSGCFRVCFQDGIVEPDLRPTSGSSESSWLFGLLGSWELVLAGERRRDGHLFVVTANNPLSSGARLGGAFPSGLVRQRRPTDALASRSAVTVDNLLASVGVLHRRDVHHAVALLINSDLRPHLHCWASPKRSPRPDLGCVTERHLHRLWPSRDIDAVGESLDMALPTIILLFFSGSPDKFGMAT